MDQIKVFCIGFHKTGTTSMGRALTELGYRVCGGFGYQDPAIAENMLHLAKARVKEYVAFQDQPWPILYKEMDTLYPNSKFILVVRNTESWIRSVVRDFGPYDTATRKLIYGVGHPKGNERLYIERYERHNKEVQEYFNSRPQDFVALHLNKGEVNWNNVCKFLGQPIPDRPWPHVNKARSKQTRKLLTKAKRKIRHILG
jgi:hypothetical protein